MYLQKGFYLQVKNGPAEMNGCVATSPSPISVLCCSHVLPSRVLHRTHVCAAIRQLLRHHVRRLLGHPAAADCGRFGEHCRVLRLRDRQVSVQPLQDTALPATATGMLTKVLLLKGGTAALQACRTGHAGMLRHSEYRKPVLEVPRQ